MSRQDKFSQLGEFADRLRTIRKRSGKTQADFAAIGGVVMNSQNRYEAGATEPSMTYFANLAGAGIDLTYLLTGRPGAGALDELAGELVSAFHRLPPNLQRAVIVSVQALVEASGASPPPSAAGSDSLQNKAMDFRSESGSD